MRDDLFEILGQFQQADIPVYLITNSMLLTDRILSVLKNMAVKLMISIDGANAQTYEAVRNGADFGRATYWTGECARSGLLEAINFTVLKSNYKEIPAFFELAASLGVKKVNLIGLKPCHHYKRELLNPSEYLEAIQMTCRGSRETAVDFFFDEPFFQAAVKKYQLLPPKSASAAGILAPSTSACIFGEYLFIEPDGTVKPCSFSPMSIDTVNGTSLVDIWRHMNTAAFFKRIKSPATRHGHCSNCGYLDDCKGCRSRTYALTGDWFGSDPCCPLTLD